MEGILHLLRTIKKLIKLNDNAYQSMPQNRTNLQVGPWSFDSGILNDSSSYDTVVPVILHRQRQMHCTHLCSMTVIAVQLSNFQV